MLVGQSSGNSRNFSLLKLVIKIEIFSISFSEFFSINSFDAILISKFIQILDTFVFKKKNKNKLTFLFKNIPIIILTAKGENEDKVKGLRLYKLIRLLQKY